MKRTFVAWVALIPCLVIAQLPDSLWTQTYGDAYQEMCFQSVLTSDEHILLAGYMMDNPNFGQDFWIVLTDTMGDSVWSRTYHSGGSNWLYDVIEMDDGGFMLFGESSSPWFENVWVVRINAVGDVVWDRMYGGSGTDRCIDVVQNEDETFTLCGITDSFGAGDYDIWLLKISDVGDSLWSRTYGSAAAEFGNAIVTTPDGYLVGGVRRTSPGNEEGVVFRISNVGDVIWERTYVQSTTCDFSTIVPLAGDRYVFGGTQSVVGLVGWMAKIEGNGDPIWQETFLEGVDSRCWSITGTSAGQFLIGGFTTPSYAEYGNGWVAKVDSNGNLEWSIAINPSTSDDWFHSVIELSSGTILASGSTESLGSGNYDFWTVALHENSTGAEEIEILPQAYSLLQNYPNPFNSSTTISFDLPRESQVLLNVFDVTGRVVATLADDVMSAGSQQIQFDASALPSGVYVYRLQAGRYSQSQKLVLLR